MRSWFLALCSVAAAAMAATAVPALDRLGDPLPEGATQRLGTLRMQCAVADLCYLPDGRGVFAIGNSIEVWDLAEGKLQAKHQVCKARVVSIVPRSDGRALLVADSARNVHVWDLEAQRASRTWPTGQATLTRARYSPDETRVLTTGARPPTLKEWDLAAGRELVSIKGKMHYFREGIYGPQGKTALVNGAAGASPILAHYDLASGELLREWHKDYYAHSRSIVLSVDGERLLVGSRHMGTEWLLGGYKLLKKYTGHHGHAVTSIAYCKDPGQILTGSRDGSIRRWDRVDGKVLLRWFPHNGHVSHIAVSPDGKWVLSCGSRMVAESSMATGDPRVKWERHGGAVQGVAFLPDGRHVLSGSTDGTLRVWDSNTGATVRVITGAKLGAYAVAVSPDGSRAAAGCKDGVLREFTLADGALLRELKGHRGYVRAVAYTHDGARLLSSAGDGSICVWARDADEPSARLEGHRGGVLAIAVSPDGKRVISGGRDGTVRLWDLGEAKLLKTLKGHRSWVEAVAFLDAGRQALSTGRDARMLRWDLAEGKLLAELAHDGRAYDVKCSPAGAKAYSGGDRAALVCWDLASGEPTHTLKGHEQAIRCLAVSPDGKRVVTAADDTSLLVWQVPGQ